ncbi:hypothetical protein ACFLRO_00870 [Bacteroidota bacterium]
MGRIIQSGDTPAKRRRAYVRSCAEVIRKLATRPVFGAEEQDMTAFLVFCLRGIYETIDESADSWDDRNYWRKAEQLRDRWSWSRKTADELEARILADEWASVPDVLVGVVPHFLDVSVKTEKRDADWWVGALATLRSEHEESTAVAR